MEEYKAEDLIHVVIVGTTSDIAKRLKGELEQNGYRVSIAPEYDVKNIDRILRVISADKACLLWPQQQRGGVSTIIGKQASRSAPPRDKLKGITERSLAIAPRFLRFYGKLRISQVHHW